MDSDFYFFYADLNASTKNPQEPNGEKNQIHAVVEVADELHALINFYYLS